MLPILSGCFMFVYIVALGCISYLASSLNPTQKNTRQKKPVQTKPNDENEDELVMVKNEHQKNTRQNDANENKPIPPKRIEQTTKVINSPPSSQLPAREIQVILVTPQNMLIKFNNTYDDMVDETIPKENRIQFELNVYDMEKGYNNFKTLILKHRQKILKLIAIGGELAWCTIRFAQKMYQDHSDIIIHVLAVDPYVTRTGGNSFIEVKANPPIQNDKFFPKDQPLVLDSDEELKRRLYVYMAFPNRDRIIYKKMYSKAVVLKENKLSKEDIIQWLELR
jgi:hypothetical protein